MRIAFTAFLFFIFINGEGQKTRNLSSGKSNLQRKFLFDNKWKFIRDSTIQAENANYNDNSWKVVQLPHDWSIEDLPLQIKDSISGPFTKASEGGTATGFVSGGTGWYRKSFNTTEGFINKIVTIIFDGVYMDADVWINGHHLGNHPYGYTPFSFELTKWLNAINKKNVIAVRVRNKGKNSRWYSGSGIYRHVWITCTDKIHIPVWGTYITTPEVSEAKANVQISNTVQNDGTKSTELTIESLIKSSKGTIVGKTTSKLISAAGSSSSVIQTISIPRPELWSTETPHLYKVLTFVHSGTNKIDSVETTFGIRDIHLDAQSGLSINGKKILLRGGCMHHDNGALGSATIDRAEERKIELLKKNGFNAIRTSHNPPSSQLLDACDRIGMLVIDEAFDMWERPKNPDDYHRFFNEWWQKDLDNMILRDRNHPSVLFWSIGNEINERADSSGLIIADKLINEVKKLDKTRPVTEALCFFWDHPGRLWNATAPAFALLDVGGYNYQWREYEPDHNKYPQRIMMGTESVPMEAFENWKMVEKHPYVIGDFVWTAVDYIGETAIGHTLLSNQKDSFSLGWPWYDSYCGDLDLTGNKKPQSYYRDVVWRQSPIEMLVHVPLPEGLKEKISYWGWPDEVRSWNWDGMEGEKMQVRVFSRASKVRLLLNGELIGEKDNSDSTIASSFFVPYAKGELKAIAFEDGKETGSCIIKTTGPAKRIKLIADRSQIINSTNDLSFINVEITDDQGNLVPNAELPVHFSISGPGEIVATGTGNPKDMSSFHKPLRKTFRGNCQVIIRPTSTGKIKLNAVADGLISSEILIIAKNE